MSELWTPEEAPPEPEEITLDDLPPELRDLFGAITGDPEARERVEQQVEKLAQRAFLNLQAETIFWSIADRLVWGSDMPTIVREEVRA